jgi:tRNA(fMet)-specific endonuclease VapC
MILDTNAVSALADKHTLEQYASIKDLLKRAGKPIPDNDIWIAAFARQYDMPVLSRDRHCDLIPSIQRLGW